MKLDDYIEIKNTVSIGEISKTVKQNITLKDIVTLRDYIYFDDIDRYYNISDILEKYLESIFDNLSYEVLEFISLKGTDYAKKLLELSTRLDDDLLSNLVYSGYFTLKNLNHKRAKSNLDILINLITKKVMVNSRLILLLKEAKNLPSIDLQSLKEIFNRNKGLSDNFYDCLIDYAISFIDSSHLYVLYTNIKLSDKQKEAILDRHECRSTRANIKNGIEYLNYCQENAKH